MPKTNIPEKASDWSLFPLSNRIIPNAYDVLVIFVLIGLFLMIADIANDMTLPLQPSQMNSIVLDPWNLMYYGMRSTLRMFLAIIASLLFTFVIATLAAKNKRAGAIIIPTLDILQSVPILGFVTFTVVFFLNLFPGKQLGAECASIFAIFTSQVWNMTFSFYQSLRTIPEDLNEVSTHFRLSPWMRFIRLEVPFATPSLVWNTMMSLSGSWFFLVASEAIIANQSKILLPGIGSWLSVAIDQRNIEAITWAIIVMGIIIFLYNQIIFQPLIVWIEKFRFEQTTASYYPNSWVYHIYQRTALLKYISLPWKWLNDKITRLSMMTPHNTYAEPKKKLSPFLKRFIDIACIILLSACALVIITKHVYTYIKISDLIEVFQGAIVTLIRVIFTLILASFIWIPIGVWLGLRPWAAQRAQAFAQFLAAFPANIFYPFFVIMIVSYNLNPTIWLSPLMMIGAQWYIFFNVIAGASAFPTDLIEVSTVCHVRTWNWWRNVILPGIFPYYVTGALTAWGAAWNASIISEFVTWGPTQLQAIGIGSYIAKAAQNSDFFHLSLGIIVLSSFVIFFNHFFWRRLFNYASKRLRLE